MTIILGARSRLSDKGINRYPKHAREGLRSWHGVVHLVLPAAGSQGRRGENYFFLLQTRKAEPSSPISPGDPPRGRGKVGEDRPSPSFLNDPFTAG
jgi:hypothetical protein